ncbi:hypothetical protein GCM10028775_33440 [Catellatospora paridis]
MQHCVDSSGVWARRSADHPPAVRGGDRRFPERRLLRVTASSGPIPNRAVISDAAMLVDFSAKQAYREISAERLQLKRRRLSSDGLA